MPDRDRDENLRRKGVLDQAKGAVDEGSGKRFQRRKGEIEEDFGVARDRIRQDLEKD